VQFFAASPRHKKFLFLLLLILSGNVEVNPGPSSTINLSPYCLNVRSASVMTKEMDKPALIQDFIIDKQADMLVVTESWLTPDSPPSALNLLTPPNYSILHTPRSSGRGGGIAAIFRSSYSCSIIKTALFSTFEHMLLKFTFSSKSYLFLTVYRPPFTSTSTSRAEFLSYFSSLLENIASTPSELFIMGDFNIHMDVANDGFAIAFSTLLDTFGLIQHISMPTHSSGHTLDLLITKNSTTLPESGTTDPFLSDHSAIFFKLPIVYNPRPSRTVKVVRKFSAINSQNFSADILDSSLYSEPASTLSEYTEQFHGVLSSILDKHAPPKQITCRSTPNKPYYTPEISEQKSERSRLETAFRNDRSDESRNKYTWQCRRVNN